MELDSGELGRGLAMGTVEVAAMAWVREQDWERKFQPVVERAWGCRCASATPSQDSQDNDNQTAHETPFLPLSRCASPS